MTIINAVLWFLNAAFLIAWLVVIMLAILWLASNLFRGR